MKKLSRAIVIFSIMLFTFLSITACSAAKKSDDEASYNSPSDSGYITDYDLAEKNGESKNINKAGASYPSQSIDYQRKVIRNAYLDIMVDDAVAFYRDIVSYGVSLGGYENNYTVDSRGDYTVINAQFKIAPEELQNFINYVSEKGTVVNNSLSSDDITESYYDVATRLETKRKSLEQYYTLLAKAKTIDEIVYVQRIIDEITEDIESLEGRLNMWNVQTEMATVTMYITQIVDNVIPKKEIRWDTISFDDMGYLIKSGFYSVTNFFVSLLQWLVIIIVGYSPVWILLTIVGFVLFRIYKKAKKAKIVVEQELPKDVIIDKPNQ